MSRAMTRKARILMTADSVGGVWNYSLDLARSLAAQKAEVIVAGLGPRPSLEQEQEASRIAGLDLVWLDAPLDWTAANAGELEIGARRIGDLAREKRVDIVHLNTPALAAGLRSDRPVVAAAHSCLATWWKAVKSGPLPEEWRWRVDLNRVAFATVDRIITPSESFAVALEKVYGPLPHLDVVRNGGAGAKIQAERRNAIVSVGRWWDEGKNLATLEVAAESVDWPIEAIGALEGPNGARAPQTTNVVRPGSMAAQDVAKKLAESRIFVSTALYEPFGLGVLEAASAGNALVLSDIPTFRELWNGAATFVDPRDPEMIARTLNRLTRQTILRDVLADAARVRAQTYTLDLQAAGTLRVYAEAAATRRRTAHAS